MSAIVYFFAFLLASVMTGHSVDFIHVGGHAKSVHCRTVRACAPAPVYVHHPQDR